MTQIVNRFQIGAVGTTRDECIDVLDQTESSVLSFIGGAPWVAVDDDIKKVQASEIGAQIVADDQGFLYVGIRSLLYKGPLVEISTAPLHDGFSLQKFGGE